MIGVRIGVGMGEGDVHRIMIMVSIGGGKVQIRSKNDQSLKAGKSVTDFFISNERMSRLSFLRFTWGTRPTQPRHANSKKLVYLFIGP